MRQYSDGEMRQLQQTGEFLRRIMREICPEAVVDDAPIDKIVWDESEEKQVMKMFPGFRVSYKGQTKIFTAYEDGPRAGQMIGVPCDFFRVPEGIAEDFSDVISRWCRELGAAPVVGIVFPDLPSAPICPDCREIMEKQPGGWKCKCVQVSPPPSGNPAVEPTSPPDVTPSAVLAEGMAEPERKRGRPRKDP